MRKTIFLIFLLLIGGCVEHSNDLNSNDASVDVAHDADRNVNDVYQERDPDSSRYDVTLGAGGSSCSGDSAAPILDAGKTSNVELLWLLIGQSNSGQRSFISDLQRLDPSNVDLANVNTNGFYSVRTQNATGFATWEWRAFSPINDKIGLEMAFSRRAGPKNHLAKFFIDGSNLDEWLSNGWDEQATSWFVERKASLERGRTIRFAGLIFVQGESGPNVGWQAKAESVVSTVRVGLNEPNLPLIVVQTSITVNKAVHDQQEQWCRDDGRCCGVSDGEVVVDSVVDTDAYPVKLGPHWTFPEINFIGNDVGLCANWLTNR